MSGVIYVYSSAYVSATHIYANIHVHTYADSWMLPPKHMHLGSVFVCLLVCARLYVHRFLPVCVWILK